MPPKPKFHPIVSVSEWYALLRKAKASGTDPLQATPNKSNAEFRKFNLLDAVGKQMREINATGGQEEKKGGERNRECNA